MNQFEQLEAWLAEHLPEVVADLGPPASEDQLRALSQAIGVDLPDEFKQLYAWHNGQAMNVNAGPWYGLNFLPLERVEQEWRSWKEVREELGPEALAGMNTSMSSTPPGFVKPLYSSALWVPFAYDWGGNYLGIDLDPDVRGTRGQVINFGRDENRKIAIAPGIGAFVEWMLGELRRGNVSIEEEDDGGRSFNTLEPRKYHFLDSLSRMFPRS